jgi:hypothetical protein
VTAVVHLLAWDHSFPPQRPTHQDPRLGLWHHPGGWLSLSPDLWGQCSSSCLCMSVTCVVACVCDSLPLISVSLSRFSSSLRLCRSLDPSPHFSWFFYSSALCLCVLESLRFSLISPALQVCPMEAATGSLPPSWQDYRLQVTHRPVRSEDPRASKMII